MNTDMCPNGYICINHLNALGIILIFIIIFYVISQNNYNNIYNKISFLEKTQDQQHTQQL